MSDREELPSRIARVNTTDTLSRESGGWRDVLGWLVLAGLGLALTAWAVHRSSRLGTAGAPFLGRYRVRISPASVLAPALGAGILALAGLDWFERARWRAVLAVSYLAGLAWALALTLVDGVAGLTRPLRDPDTYPSDVPAVGHDPLDYLRHYVSAAAGHSVAARGHPPGPVLLLWAVERLGVRGDVALALLLTAFGALTVPLVLAVVRDVCGELPARRYVAVLVLAPYAIWRAASMDVVVPVLGAAMAAAGVRASAPGRTGLRAGAWAVACGVLLGLAALFSYAAAWLGLCAVCLYFARRRPLANIGTGLGALLPVLAAGALGFGWLSGLRAAQADYSSRVEPYRPMLWWIVLSLVALLLATGPPLYASARKLRNTPGWAFLVGAGVAVVFSLLAGMARGGVEHAWLAFFPWLTIATVAPEHQAGPPAPAPLPLVAVGAATAIAVKAVLAVPG